MLRLARERAETAAGRSRRARIVVIRRDCDSRALPREWIPMIPTLCFSRKRKEPKKNKKNTGSFLQGDTRGRVVLFMYARSWNWFGIEAQQKERSMHEFIAGAAVMSEGEPEDPHPLFSIVPHATAYKRCRLIRSPLDANPCMQKLENERRK